LGWFQRDGEQGNKFLYNGKELQEETGMFDFGARMYMPDLGRWGVIDPLADKNSFESPFTYVSNNPLIYVDPTGEDKVKALLVFNYNNQFVVNYDDKTGQGSISGIRRTNGGKQFVTGQFDSNKGSFSISSVNSDGDGKRLSTDKFDGFNSLQLSSVSGQKDFDENGFNGDVEGLQNQEFVDLGVFLGGQIMRSQKDENGAPSIHGDFIRLFESNGEEFGPLNEGRSSLRTLSDMIENEGVGETFRITINNISEGNFDIFNILNELVGTSPKFNISIIINNTIEEDDEDKTE
jgi:RHS repeat-associated protein